MQREGRAAGRHDDRLRRRPRPAGGADLEHRPGRGERRDEAGGGAVEARRFGAVEFDHAVVDAKPGEGGEEVFDERDAVRRRAERGAAVGAGHDVGAGGDRRRGRAIGAAEDEAGVGRGRQKTDADAGSGDEAHALDLRGGRQRPLVPVADDAHGVRLSGVLPEVQLVLVLVPGRPWPTRFWRIGTGRGTIIVPRPRRGSHLTAGRDAGLAAGAAGGRDRRSAVSVLEPSTGLLRAPAGGGYQALSVWTTTPVRSTCLATKNGWAAGGFSFSSFTSGSSFPSRVTASG